jgi:transgelin
MKPSPVGTRGAGYGLDAELARKQAEKYDHQGELMARNWIENVTHEKVEGEFGAALKNGQLLCKLMNTIKPGSIRKVETSNMPFKQMENISNFLKAARTVGIAEYELFETVDLYEEKVSGRIMMNV